MENTVRNGEDGECSLIGLPHETHQRRFTLCFFSAQKSKDIFPLRNLRTYTQYNPDREEITGMLEVSGSWAVTEALCPRPLHPAVRGETRSQQVQVRTGEANVEQTRSAHWEHRTHTPRVGEAPQPSWYRLPLPGRGP